MAEIPPYSVFAKPDRVVVDDGTELSYGVLGETGDRAPIVFANGWSCSDSYWRWIAPAMVEAGHPCLLFDTRGHGESGLPRAPGRGAKDLRADDVSIPRLAADLHHLLDHVGFNDAVAVGHSMGVQTILESARAHDGRLSALVAVAGSYENPLATFYGMPFGFIDATFPIAKAIVQGVPELLGPLWNATDNVDLGLFVAKLVRAAGPKASVEGIGPYLLHLAAKEPAVLFSFVEGMRHHSASDVLPTLDIPLLILGASNDTFTPPRCSKAMAELAPTSELVWFPDGHHTLPIEEPERCVQEIHRFLRQ